MTEKILELTKIEVSSFCNVGWGSTIEEIIEIIFNGLTKLRILAIILPLIMLSVPESVRQLKHLRYLSFGI